MNFLNKKNYNVSNISKLRIAKNLFVILITTLDFGGKIYAQNDLSENVCDCSRDSLIRTILLFRKGWDLSPPVVYFRENEKLDLEFDDLGERPTSYNYSVAGCTYDWKLNDIGESEYIEGFNNEPIYDRNPSVNTLRSYTHYSAVLPDDNLNITRSGNYVLRVSGQDDPQKIIFTRRFCLVDRLTDITGSVTFPDDKHQEIHIEIDLGDLAVDNPLGEIRTVVIKNYDWNNVIKITSPPQLQGNKLVYDLPYQIEADGGNEFRYFNSKNTRITSERIDRVEFRPPYYHFYLKQDEPRELQPYFSYTDIDG